MRLAASKVAAIARGDRIFEVMLHLSWDSKGRVARKKAAR
jgi:hypothetical protein